MAALLWHSAGLPYPTDNSTFGHSDSLWVPKVLSAAIRVADTWKDER